MRQTTEPLTLPLPGRRRMAWAEYGDPDGLPVIALHGTPGSRRMYAPANDAARALGLRLICPERPGYGVSSPAARPTLRRHVRDCLKLADHLGLDRFAVIGVSGGAPYAAALAALAPARLQALALVSPVGPMAGRYAPRKIGRMPFALFRVGPALPGVMRGVFAIGRFGFRFAPGAMVKVVMAKGTAADRRMLSRTEVRRSLFADVAEGLVQGGVGARADMANFAAPWDVPLDHVAAPAIVWQGLADRTVSVPAALRLADLLPECELRALPGEGHYWIFDHIPEVLQALADAAHGNARVGE